MLQRFIDDLAAPSTYKDRSYTGTSEQFYKDISSSSTLYIGNLSFYTSEEQLFELFSKIGEVRRLIMGLDRIKKTPCGFAFIEYRERTDAIKCKKYIDGTKLDERFIRVDVDPGFVEGRQYGRGRSGGQVRDEFRQDYDPGRGGWGKLLGSSDGATASSERNDSERYGKRARYSSNNNSSTDRAEEEKSQHKLDNPRFREKDEED